MKVGSAVKRVREAQGLTQVDLAQRAGLCKRYVVQIENAPGYVPSMKVVAKLAGALRVSVKRLLGPLADL
jgi:transcriptional regulator with XRE-family HTH domain